MKNFLILVLLISFSCKDKDDKPCLDKNCSDFKTQAEAKATYDTDPGCHEDLDTDNDGLPCEHLPK